MEANKVGALTETALERRSAVVRLHHIKLTIWIRQFLWSCLIYIVVRLWCAGDTWGGRKEGRHFASAVIIENRSAFTYEDIFEPARKCLAEVKVFQMHEKSNQLFLLVLDPSCWWTYTRDNNIPSLAKRYSLATNIDYTQCEVQHVYHTWRPISILTVKKADCH